MNYHCKGYKRLSLSVCSGDKLDCSILRSNIKEKQSTQKMRHLMRRDRERGREPFTTAVSTHIQSTKSADVGGEWWCAGRMSDLAILPLCVKRRSVVPGGVPYWGSAVDDLSGCLLALLMKT